MEGKANEKETFMRLLQQYRWKTKRACTQIALVKMEKKMEL